MNRNDNLGIGTRPSETCSSGLPSNVEPAPATKLKSGKPPGSMPNNVLFVGRAAAGCGFGAGYTCTGDQDGCREERRIRNTRASTNHECPQPGATQPRPAGHYPGPVRAFQFIAGLSQIVPLF